MCLGGGRGAEGEGEQKKQKKQQGASAHRVSSPACRVVIFPFLSSRELGVLLVYRDLSGWDQKMDYTSPSPSSLSRSHQAHTVRMGMVAPFWPALNMLKPERRPFWLLLPPPPSLSLSARHACC